MQGARGSIEDVRGQTDELRATVDGFREEIGGLRDRIRAASPGSGGAATAGRRPYFRACAP